MAGGPPFQSPQRRVPHPFALFANGWETTNPTADAHGVEFLSHAKGVVRYQKSGDSHFVTFSCYRRAARPFSPTRLGAPSIRALCEWVGEHEPHSGCPRRRIPLLCQGALFGIRNPGTFIPLPSVVIAGSRRWTALRHTASSSVSLRQPVASMGLSLPDTCLCPSRFICWLASPGFIALGRPAGAQAENLRKAETQSRSAVLATALL
jgi:hypothetical protein